LKEKKDFRSFYYFACLRYIFIILNSVNCVFQTRGAARKKNKRKSETKLFFPMSSHELPMVIFFTPDEGKLNFPAVGEKILKLSNKMTIF
jgi:hypothetical protein